MTKTLAEVSKIFEILKSNEIFNYLMLKIFIIIKLPYGRNNTNEVKDFKTI